MYLLLPVLSLASFFFLQAVLAATGEFRKELAASGIKWLVGESMGMGDGIRIKRVVLLPGLSCLRERGTRPTALLPLHIQM